MPEESASKTAASILVLLIDDEESQMELTKLNLELADPAFTITTRLSPIDALGLLQVQPFARALPCP